jgi:ATP-dependent exoDNAse (exonuclease V) alpha subunit
MVSSSLLHEVLVTFDHGFRIYLIGDVSQLPPIEWGRPFFDLIMTKRIPTYFLTKCHRFYEQGGEVNGILENATGMIKSKEWQFAERKNFKILKNSTIVKVIQKVIDSNISMNDFTILCPFNKPLKDLNQRASQMFLPDQPSMTDPSGRI